MASNRFADKHLQKFYERQKRGRQLKEARQASGPFQRRVTADTGKKTGRAGGWNQSTLTYREGPPEPQKGDGGAAGAGEGGGEGGRTRIGQKRARRTPAPWTSEAKRDIETRAGSKARPVLEAIDADPLLREDLKTRLKSMRRRSVKRRLLLKRLVRWAEEAPLRGDEPDTSLLQPETATPGRATSKKASPPPASRGDPDDVANIFAKQLKASDERRRASERPARTADRAMHRAAPGRSSRDGTAHRGAQKDTGSRPEWNADTSDTTPQKKLLHVHSRLVLTAEEDPELSVQPSVKPVPKNVYYTNLRDELAELVEERVEHDEQAAALAERAKVEAARRAASDPRLPSSVRRGSFFGAFSPEGAAIAAAAAAATVGSPGAPRDGQSLRAREKEVTIPDAAKPRTHQVPKDIAAAVAALLEADESETAAGTEGARAHSRGTTAPSSAAGGGGAQAGSREARRRRNFRESRIAPEDLLAYKEYEDKKGIKPMVRPGSHAELMQQQRIADIANHNIRAFNSGRVHSAPAPAGFGLAGKPDASGLLQPPP